VIAEPPVKTMAQWNAGRETKLRTATRASDVERMRTAKGPKRLRGCPVIAVGDVAAYESMAQAAKMCGVAKITMRRAMCDMRLVGGRPWLYATPPLLTAMLAGGWPEADRQGYVPPWATFAIMLGRLVLRGVRPGRSGKWAGRRAA
jgi:hypothetical protein